MTQSALSNDQLRAVLGEIWEKSLPVLKQRVDVLEQAVAALATGTPAQQLCAQAGEEAHKLAGLLGTFGYPAGTDAARMLELVFDAQGEQGGANATQHSGEDISRWQDAVVVLRKIVGE